MQKRFLTFIFLTSLVVNLSVPKPLRDFRDRKELEDFLYMDKTDEIDYYSENFTCRNYAFLVCKNAAKHGYFIGVLRNEARVFRGNNDTRLHDVCYAYSGEEDVYWAIEPQSDKIIGYTNAEDDFVFYWQEGVFPG